MQRLQVQFYTWDTSRVHLNFDSENHDVITKQYLMHQFFSYAFRPQIILNKSCSRPSGSLCSFQHMWKAWVKGSMFGFDRREQAVVSLAPDGHKILFLCNVCEKCQMSVANILQFTYFNEKLKLSK